MKTQQENQPKLQKSVNRNSLAAWTCILLLFTSAKLAHADSNLLQNGSFELYTGPANGVTIFNLPVGDTDITGWTIINGPLDFINGWWQAADGYRSLDLGGTPGAGGVMQTFSTTPGTSYKLSFYMSGNPDHLYDSSLKTMQVQIAGLTQDFTFDTAIVGNNLSDMKWQFHSFQFVAISDSTTLAFINTMGTVREGPALDNVAVTLVPEPSPLLMLCLCGIGLFSLTKRRAARGTGRGQTGYCRISSITRIHGALLLCAALSQAVAFGTVLTFDELPGMSLSQPSPIPDASKLSDGYLSTLGIRFSSGSPFVVVTDLGVGHAPSGANAIFGTDVYGSRTGTVPIEGMFFIPSDPSIPAVTDYVAVTGDTHGNPAWTITLSVYDINSTLVGSTSAPDSWGGTTVAFTAVGIHSFRIGSNAPDGDSVAFDNVTFNTLQAVPEPSSLFLLCLFLAAALSRLKRDRGTHGVRASDRPTWLNFLLPSQDKMFFRVQSLGRTPGN